MLNVITYTTVLLSLASAQGYGDDEDTWYADCVDSNNDYYLSTVRNNGQLTYWRCDDDQYLKVKIAKLQEVDSDGNNVESNVISTFYSGSWSWIKDGSNVGYTLVSGDVTITLYATVLAEDSDFEWTSGEKNELKWGFSVTGWDFEADTNQLQATLYLDAKGGGDSYDNYADNGGYRRRLALLESTTTTGVPGEYTTAYWRLQGFPIWAPEQGTIMLDDDSSDLVDVGVSAVLDDKRATFTVTAPYFAATSTLDYDPLVEEYVASEDDGDSSDEDGDSDSGAGSNSTQVAAISVLFLALFQKYL